MTTIPDCARGCALIQYLLAELARARGTSEAVQHVTYGIEIDDEPPRPR